MATEMDYSAPTHFAAQLEIYAEVDTVPLSAMYAALVDDAGGGQVGYESLDGGSRDWLRDNLHEACEGAVRRSLEAQGYALDADAVTLAAKRLADAIEHSPAPGYVYESPRACARRWAADKAAARKSKQG